MDDIIEPCDPIELIGVWFGEILEKAWKIELVFSQKSGSDEWLNTIQFLCFQ